VANKKVVIHIGTDKTGSTAIQRFIFDNKVALEEKGVSVVPSQYKHHGHVFDAVDAGFWNKITSIVDSISKSNISNHLISFEGLYHISGENLKNFINHFSIFDVVVIIYFRNRGDKIRSGFSQRLKIHKIDEGSSFLNEVVKNEDYEKLAFDRSLDYDAIVQRWELALQGIGRLKVGIYEKSSLVNGSVIEDFLYQAECFVSGEIDFLIANSLIDKNAILNPSISPAGQCVMVLAAALGLNHTSLKSLRELIYKIDDPSERNHSIVPEAIVKLSNERYAKGDKRIAKKYLSRRRLFIDPPKFSYVNTSISRVLSLASNIFNNDTMLFNNVAKSKNDEINSYAVGLRDVAVRIESDRLNDAHLLMKLAGVIQPDSLVIKRKLEIYESFLEK
tara:strand:- start:9470 stop:10639 length:1170 start_codon:yes stop_codon:yes gene_type:complete